MAPPDADPVLPRTMGALAAGRDGGWHLGAQLSVALNGQPPVHLAFGERRPGEPLTTDTLLLWRSAGKPLTTIAVAQLQERGRLDFADPVVAHLPEFAAGGKARITIAHLLTHTAGFRDADLIPENLDWESTLRAICAAPLEPGWVPGISAGYQTQASWFVLAEIVQRLDGRVFPQFLREEILRPLGMHDTWAGMAPTDYRRYGSRLGTTYLTFPPPARPHPNWDSAEACARCRPGGNTRGPASDLLRLYQTLLSGTPGILRPSTVQELIRRRRSGVFDQTFRHVVDLGLGFIVNSSHHGIDTVPYGYGRHASPDTFGHSGAQCACAFADPEAGLAVAWVCNGLPGEPRHQRRQRSINTAIYEDLGLA